MDMDNDYSHAGPGFKRRAKREKPDRIETDTAKRSKPKKYLQKPEFEKRKAKRDEMSEAFHSAIGVKARIRMLVIDHDMGYLDICETMKRAKCPVSGITIGNLRAEMREILHLLISVGLIDRDDLARYRRQFKKKQAREHDE